MPHGSDHARYGAAEEGDARVRTRSAGAVRGGDRRPDGVETHAAASWLEQRPRDELRPEARSPPSRPLIHPRHFGPAGAVAVLVEDVDLPEVVLPLVAGGAQ